MEIESKMDRLNKLMKETKQNSKQTIWDHGIDVSLRQKNMISNLMDSNIKLEYNYVLPEFYDKLKLLFKNNSSKIDINDIYIYGLYHDCGKPFCLKIDENGRNHFPNHEIISYQKWKEYSNNDFIAELIKYDMVLHKSKKEDLEKIGNELTNIQWIILMITGICEIHSNAEMFGGIDSTNFKIKYKKFIKNSQFILKKFFGNNL